MSVPAGNGPGWETVAVVHCQDGSNPPSPAPPLVLGTLLPHFVSGKFSRLLAQAQGRISRRRRLCAQLAPPGPASRPELTGQTRGHGGAGAAGQGCSPRRGFMAPVPAAAPAPAQLPPQHPRSEQGLTKHGSPSRARRFCTPPGWKAKACQHGERLVSSPSAPELSWSEARRARWLL